MAISSKFFGDFIRHIIRKTAGKQIKYFFELFINEKLIKLLSDSLRMGVWVKLKVTLVYNLFKLYLLRRIIKICTYNIMKVIKISNLEDISSTVGNHRNPQKEEQDANSCCHSLYIRTVSSDPVFYFADPV